MQIQTVEDLEKITSAPEWKDVLQTVVNAEGFDAWSIDLAKLADAYLNRVKAMQNLSLKVSANVFLAASILLRCKADSWRLFPEPEVPPEIPDMLIEEPVIPQLFPLMRDTERKVTYDELVEAIERAISFEKKKATRQPKVLFPPEPLLRLVGPIQLFDERLTQLHDALRTRADSNGLVAFTDLLKERTPREVIENLVLLLHLANNDRVRLWQEEFFKEIFITVQNGHNGNGENGGNAHATTQSEFS